MNKSFIILHGVLTVAAKGYWYTNGGEKGSFGYYPHLKNKQQPIYPDTQIHGDLRMAAQWLTQLSPEKDYSGLIDKLFGRTGNTLNSMLYMQDLSLSPAAQKQWSVSRFDVKPRIEIDDETRSVKKNMLMSFEAAWLDQLSLEAPFFAGYFNTAAEAETAQQLLEESVQLLSGFGAFRSRGYGRGHVRIVWHKEQQITFTPQTVPAAPFNYALKNLNNMRSKPVATERLQLVSTHNHIDAEQLRSWFVRTYKEVTDHWPQAGDMASITFNNLYPSLAVDNPAFVPPNTILRREDGSSIDDYWKEAQGEELEQSTSETILKKSKLKPLKSGTYVTMNGQLLSPEIGVRLRNSINDDFTTLDEGGLFVQQYLASGTTFCGQISVSVPESEFGRTAGAILKKFYPTINGTIFEPAFGDIFETDKTNHPVRLVGSPLPFDPNKKIGNAEGITIGTHRRYAPVLGRPRRNRTVILPGSIIMDSVAGTIDWRLFGENIEKQDSSKDQEMVYPRQKTVVPLNGNNIEWNKITRSQAGVLRELLNPGHNSAVINKYLTHIYEKHQEKGASSLATLYSSLVEVHKQEGMDGLRDEINQILEYLKIEIWWKNKAALKGGNE